MRICDYKCAAYGFFAEHRSWASSAGTSNVPRKTIKLPNLAAGVAERRCGVSQNGRFPIYRESTKIIPASSGFWRWAASLAANEERWRVSRYLSGETSHNET